MNERTRTGLEILQAAVLLGISGDILLRETPWGLNFFLWIALLVAALTALALRRGDGRQTAQTYALRGALLFFGLMYVWRDSIELKMLDFLAVVVALSLLVLPALRVRIASAGIFNYLFGAVWSGLSAVFGPLLLVIGDIGWKTIPQTGWSKRLVAVVRGLAVAVPLLFVFGGLFMAADAVFEGLVEDTLRIDPEQVFTHIFLTCFLTWITAGYLRAYMFGGVETAVRTPSAAPASETRPPFKSVTEEDPDEKRDEPAAPETSGRDDRPPSVTSDQSGEEKSAAAVDGTQEEQKKRDWRRFENDVLPAWLTLGGIEVSLILGLTNLLFLVFVLVQLPYLFGGFELVQSTPGFKLSEYARRGFGELVAVSALVLPLLLATHWLLRRDEPLNERIYRALAGIQLILLFVIMASATQRLLLLTGSLGYGLTTVRFYPMAFMVFLALVFVWFALTVLRGARRQFAWGAVWIAFFVLGALHVVNPDDFIVRTNTALMEQGREFDGHYNSALSDDAVPALLEVYERIPSKADRCDVSRNLTLRLKTARTENDPRTWNYARWLARHTLERNAAALAPAADCPPPARAYPFAFD